MFMTISKIASSHPRMTKSGSFPWDYVHDELIFDRVDCVEWGATWEPFASWNDISHMGLAEHNFPEIIASVILENPRFMKGEETDFDPRCSDYTTNRVSKSRYKAKMDTNIPEASQAVNSSSRNRFASSNANFLGRVPVSQRTP